MEKIVQCVPNFSEGRNPETIEKIVSSFRDKPGVKLLDFQSDADHHRMVVTVAGDPEAVKSAVVEAAGAAISLIDMNSHRGQHPRMGAVDVVPLIPIRKVTMDEAVALSKELAREMAETYNLPIFLYEKSAARPDRENLSDIRKGQFEEMAQKIKQPNWRPDFGPAGIHPTAGVTAVGARMPLVAFNVNLNTGDRTVADRIAKRVRHTGGGLRFCKAIGVTLRENHRVQVSMNLTDFTRTALYRAFELIRIEAGRYGVTIAGSEIVGLVPMAALVDTAAFYLGLEDFSTDQILESKLTE